MRQRVLVTNCLIIMVLLGLLASVAILSLSPWYFFGLGRPPVLRVGFVASEKSDSLYLAAKAAVEDINLSVETMSPSPPRVTLIKAKLGELLRAYDEDEVRVFVVANEGDTKVVQKEILQLPDDAVVLTLSSWSKDEHGIIGTNIGISQEIRGYLALMASRRPSEKRLHVVPVWEKNAYNQRLYDDLLSMAEKDFPEDLKFTLPVTYEASQYPTSDGIQAVSEIGSRLVLQPDAHIFFLTSTRLLEVVEASKMNKELGKEGQLWYARGILEQEETLQSIETTCEDFCRQTSLTTLSFLSSSKDESRELELLRRSMEHDINGSSALMYMKFLTYSTVYDLHKSFTESILLQRSLAALIRRDIESKAKVAGALTFFGGGEEAPQVLLPMGKWMVTHKIDIADNQVEEIPTHPLLRSELESLLNGSSLHVEECEEPKIKFWLHPSLILPRIHLEFSDLKQLPEALVLPAQKGISVSLQCSRAASITAHCVPRKFNQGTLTCRLASTFPTVEASIKSKRSIEENTSKVTLTSILEDVNKNVRPIWSALAPDAFACTTSLAGCDFCFYYLSTYNLSVAPAACVGGCSLGAFSSCSKLITSSLLKTLDLN